MSRPRPRRLVLHPSALSDAEYAVYVDALHDVLDEPGINDVATGGGGMSDEELETRMIGVREARAWMRGRYRDVGVGEIDMILQMFAPDLHKDCISGGQFLAALRLLMHARNGSEINEGLVFIQADPSTPTTAHPPLTSNPTAIGLQAFSFPPTSDPPTSDLPGTFSATSHPPPPIHPASTLASSDSVQVTARTQTRSNSNPFILDPAPAPPSSKTEPPFSIRRASLSSAPASSTPSSVPPPVPPSSSKPSAKAVSPKPSDQALPITPVVQPGSTNPFLQRAKTHSGAHGPGSGSPGMGVGKTPPLPPRKPSYMLGPGSPAINSPLSSSSSTPTVTMNLISPLMKQSLEASKQGHALKKAQEEAERARVLEVIQSSNNSALSDRDRGRASSSRSPTKGLSSHNNLHAGNRRPVPSPPRSAVSTVFSATSAGSFDQVASARLGQYAHGRMASPERLSSGFSSGSSGSGNSVKGIGSGTKKTPEHLPALDESFASGSGSGAGLGQSPYSAPPTHPDRRPGGTSRQAHRRSPSYQSTPAYSTYTSRSSHPSRPGSRGSPTEEEETPTPSLSNVRTRTTRSQSVHHQTSPTVSSSPFDTNTKASSTSGRASPPLPPPRRKRPESVQLAPKRVFDPANGDEQAGSPFANAFASAREREEKEKAVNTPLSLSSLQRSLSTLQSRAQPVLDRARYKAEAGLSRRGFMPNTHHHHGDEGVDHLVSHGTGDTSDGNADGGGMDSGLDVDSLTGSDDEGERGRRGRTPYPLSGGYGYKPEVRERDDLKLPVEDEGWRPL